MASVRIKNILLTGMTLFMPVIGVSAQSFRDSVELEPIVVTASHTPKALKDAPVVTRLITLHDIKITDATNIQDLLIQEIPGLEFGFAMSQETALHMSGFRRRSMAPMPSVVSSTSSVRRTWLLGRSM